MIAVSIISPSIRTTMYFSMKFVYKYLLKMQKATADWLHRRMKKCWIEILPSDKQLDLWKIDLFLLYIIYRVFLGTEKF